MAQPLITPDERAKLLSNGEVSARGVGHDPYPVVKLFTPDGSATWLLSELNPAAPDRAFGLCDLGLGSPELGYVSMAELEDLRGWLGLPVERDIAFRPRMTLSRYAAHARQVGFIRA